MRINRCPSLSLCDRVTRRAFLQIGGLGALSMSLADGRRAQGETVQRQGFGRARSCIILWMTGGPPQHETWDPKPDAPGEIRGPFGSISTSLPGVRVGELMPRTAQILDRLAVLRGVHTDNPSHPGSSYEMFTGTVHPRGKGRDDVVDSRSDFPNYAALVNRFRPAPAGTPTSVVMPEPIFNVPFYPGQNAGFLGSQWDPWLLTCDPTAEDFQVPELKLGQDVSRDRLVGRRRLLDQADQALSRGGSIGQYAARQGEALELLGGGSIRQAFDLSREPAEVRDAYGRHKFGQCCLLSRRLVEAGVPFVQVNWHRAANDDTPMWDAHWKLEENLKNKLMPPMDQAYPTLLDDLQQRGLLAETLVIWMGEFGRTPKLEYVQPHPTVGCNHWGNVFSIALAGAGIRGGVVHGSSDKDGAFPHDFPVEPPDLLATMFHALGISPELEIRDPLNRPFPLSRGRVLDRLF
ncbi:MAG: DUF1501 domain-containing protein [Planctomycetia bacterium]|nr:DUF1501 domain-containing protein [Planctomycetia bacterium]